MSRGASRHGALLVALLVAVAVAACGAPRAEPVASAAPRVSEPVPTIPEPIPIADPPPPPPPPAREIRFAMSSGERVFVLGEAPGHSPSSTEGAARLDTPAPVYVHAREGAVPTEPYHLFAADGTRCEGRRPRAVVLHQPREPGPAITNHAIEVDATCAAVLAVRAEPAEISSARFVPAAESVVVSRPRRGACAVLEATNAAGVRVELRPMFEATPLGVLEVGGQRVLVADSIRRTAYDLAWARPREIADLLVPGRAARRDRCRRAPPAWPREPPLEGSLDVYSVNRFLDRTFVIIDEDPPGEPAPWTEDLVVRAIPGEAPTPTTSLFTDDGARCEGLQPRWVRIDRYSDAWEGLAASFLAVEVDATCEARLAVVAPLAVRDAMAFTVVTNRVASGAGVETGELGAGWTYERRRGAPIDEICFGPPTTTLVHHGTTHLRFTAHQGEVRGRLELGGRPLLVGEYGTVVDLSWASAPLIESSECTPTNMGDGDDRCD